MWGGGKIGSPASGCAGDTYSNGDTVFVKGLSAAPADSQSRSPFYLCYCSITFLNLCVSGSVFDCSPLVTRSHPQVDCTYRKLLLLWSKLTAKARTDVAWNVLEMLLSTDQSRLGKSRQLQWRLHIWLFCVLAYVCIWHCLCPWSKCRTSEHELTEEHCMCALCLGNAEHLPLSQTFL